MAWAAWAAVLAAGIRPQMTRTYLEEMDEKPFDELDGHLSEELDLIDVRLYHAVMKASKGVVYQEYADSITADAVFGNGRQALRVIDGFVLQEIYERLFSRPPRLLSETDNETSLGMGAAAGYGLSGSMETEEAAAANEALQQMLDRTRQLPGQQEA